MENTSLYYDEETRTWFLFTNHVGLEDGLKNTDTIIALSPLSSAFAAAAQCPGLYTREIRADSSFSRLRSADVLRRWYLWGRNQANQSNLSILVVIKSARPLIPFSLPAFLPLEFAQGAVAGQFDMAIGDQTFHLFVVGEDR